MSTIRPDFIPKQPQHLWDTFFDLTQRPRPSKHEQAVVEYLKSQANEHQCEFFIDAADNSIIKVAGTKGREQEPPVLIQNHIDMVCDKLPEVDHDFHKDPIPLKLDGEWLTTMGTTLGADNGIGVAAALAILKEDNISHPPLELLFTTDEETGLNGALNLETTNIQATRMLNLDSEMWGELTVGCAGGKEVQLSKSFNSVAINTSHEIVKIEFKGLRGGHSGVDIHLQQGNAIKIMADFLSRCPWDQYQLLEVVGGKAHNIIPRTCSAIISLSKNDISKCEKLLTEFTKETSASLYEEDSLQFELTSLELSPEQRPLSQSDVKEFIQIVHSIPHGAHKYDLKAPNKLVRLSSNLAELKLIHGELISLSSYRFMDQSDQYTFENNYQILADQFSLSFNLSSGYPNWKPDFSGKLLAQVQNIYRDEFQIDPIVSGIHAGLECGIIKEKIEATPNKTMDIISFGPTIMAAHTPKERVNIPSVDKFWSLLIKVLEKI